MAAGKNSTTMAELISRDQNQCAMSRLRETYKQLRQKKEHSPPADYVTRPAKQHKTYFENRSFVYVDHSQRRLSTQHNYENSIKSLNLLNPPAFNYL